MTSWAEYWSRLISVQRTRNMAGAFDAKVRAALGEFATFAVVEAADARWKPVAGTSTPVKPRKSLTTAPSLSHRAALVLRLRLGLGVGLRPDVLGFLMTASHGPHTVRGIATALAYTEPATRRVLDDLAAAGFVSTVPGERPARYTIEDESWQGLLRLAEPPPAWRYWQQVFSLLAAVIAWHESSRDKTISAFALEALGWEIIEKHILTFRLNRLPVRIDAASRPDFAETIIDLCKWIESHT